MEGFALDHLAPGQMVRLTGTFTEVHSGISSKNVSVTQAKLHYNGKIVHCVWFNNAPAPKLDPHTQYQVYGEVKKVGSDVVLWEPLLRAVPTYAAQRKVTKKTATLGKTKKPLKMKPKHLLWAAALIPLLLVWSGISGRTSPPATNSTTTSATTKVSNTSSSNLSNRQTLSDTTSQSPAATPAPAKTAAPTSTTSSKPTPVISPTSSTLTNNNYYTNSSGNTVHSPATTTDNSIPANASAQCQDGSYSFSASRSGTCSHHGGVARWL